MKVVDVDLWEKDAILEVDGKRHYFQFSEEPSIEEALDFLKMQFPYDGGDLVSTGVDSRDGNTVGDDRKSSK